MTMTTIMLFATVNPHTRRMRTRIFIFREQVANTIAVAL